MGNVYHVLYTNSHILVLRPSYYVCQGSEKAVPIPHNTVHTSGGVRLTLGPAMELKSHPGTNILLPLFTDCQLTDSRLYLYVFS